MSEQTFVKQLRQHRVCTGKTWYTEIFIEAADHIDAQAKQIEELERDLDWLDKKIGAFGDVDDGRTKIMRLQAACHVLCHRDRIATQLESERAAQAERIEELEAGPKWEVFRDCLDRGNTEIKRLRAVEETVNAFKEGADGIHKLVTEIIDGRAELAHLREVVADLGKCGESLQAAKHGDWIRGIGELSTVSETRFVNDVGRNLSQRAAAAKGESDG